VNGGIPRESECDFLTEAANVFMPTQSAKDERAKKVPRPTRAAAKKTASKKKVA
jgi:hypothetical protein